MAEELNNKEFYRKVAALAAVFHWSESDILTLPLQRLDTYYQILQDREFQEKFKYYTSRCYCKTANV